MLALFPITIGGTGPLQPGTRVLHEGRGSHKTRGLQGQQRQGEGTGRSLGSEMAAGTGELGARDHIGQRPPRSTHGGQERPEISRSMRTAGNGETLSYSPRIRPRDAGGKGHAPLPRYWPLRQSIIRSLSVTGTQAFYSLRPPLPRLILPACSRSLLAPATGRGEVAVGAPGSTASWRGDSHSGCCGGRFAVGLRWLLLQHIPGEGRR